MDQRQKLQMRDCINSSLNYFMNPNVFKMTGFISSILIKTVHSWIIENKDKYFKDNINIDQVWSDLENRLKNPIRLEDLK